VVTITILKLFVVQMLIGQNLLLIEDILLGIMFPLKVTSFLERARNKFLWQDLVHKKNIDI